MISSELLANKIQEIMGAQYKCVPFHLYLSNYTNPVQTPEGMDYTIDAQAFEIDRGFIPCVVKCTEARPNSAPYEAKSLTYEATFSVPQNITKRDKNGEVIEPPEFDFFGDFKRLYAAVKYTELEFKDEYDPDTDTYAKTYYGRMTISEPAMIGREYDKQERLLWRVTGNFEIYDEVVRTGKDIKICVVLGGEEHEFTNPANISFDSDRNGQSAQTAEGLSNKLITSTKSNTVSFAVEDVGDGPAINLLRDLADKNPDSVETTAGVKHRKSKVKVIIYRNSSERRRFWAIPVVAYSAAGVSSVGAFSVSFIDDGMEE